MGHPDITKLSLTEGDYLSRMAARIRELKQAHDAGQIARLREAAERYHRHNPFEVGQLVTPVADSAMRGPGQPHLVIEVAGPPHRHFGSGDTSSQNYGVSLDMRVLVVYGDRTVAFWVESALFQPYHGE